MWNSSTCYIYKFLRHLRNIYVVSTLCMNLQVTNLQWAILKQSTKVLFTIFIQTIRLWAAKFVGYIQLISGLIPERISSGEYECESVEHTGYIQLYATYKIPLCLMFYKAKNTMLYIVIFTDDDKFDICYLNKFDIMKVAFDINFW